MLAFTDPEDHKLMLKDMKKQQNDLRRDLHMKEIKKLAQRRHGLKVMTTQANVITVLQQQLKDLKVEVKNIYSPKNATQDRDSKGYLIYLLNMKDHYGKTVDKLKEQLKESENNHKDAHSKLSSKKKEYAKKLKKHLVGCKSLEKGITMYEGRIERANYEMGLLASKNREFRDIIKHTFIVRGNYMKVYRVYAKRNDDDKSIIFEHLEKAVTAYRSREDFIYKTEILKERFEVDMQKIAVNNILFHRLKERYRKAKEFEDFKAQERADCRASQIEEQVRKGVTGLEPDLDKAKTKHVKVMEVSGASSVEDMRDMFEKSENENFNFFCYINTLHEEMDALNGKLKVLKLDIQNLDKNLTEDQRKCRWSMLNKKNMVNVLQTDVEDKEYERDQMKEQLETTSELIHHLLPEYESSSVEKVLTGEDLVEILLSLESKVAEYLMMIEYINCSEVSEDETDKRKELDEDIENKSLEHTNEAVLDCRPRSLREENVPVVRDLMANTDFLPLDELKQTATSVVEKDSISSNGLSTS